MLFAGLRVKAAISVGTSAEANEAALCDLVSTSRGLNLSRMTTTQRDAIASPLAGLLIFNISTDLINFYDGTEWVQLSPGGSGSPSISTYIEFFTNADLAGGVLTAQHDLNQRPVAVQIYNNNWDTVIPDNVNLLTVNIARVDLSSFVPITGIWSVIVVA